MINFVIWILLSVYSDGVSVTKYNSNGGPFMSSVQYSAMSKSGIDSYGIAGVSSSSYGPGVAVASSSSNGKTLAGNYGQPTKTENVIVANSAHSGSVAVSTGSKKASLPIAYSPPPIFKPNKGQKFVKSWNDANSVAIPNNNIPTKSAYIHNSGKNIPPLNWVDYDQVYAYYDYPEFYRCKWGSDWNDNYYKCPEILDFYYYYFS